MKIGLVGYFGWGNFGDELFVRTYQQSLGPFFELVVLHDLLERPYYSSSIDEAVDAVDAIIIGGGDLVIPWSLSGLYWRSEYLRRPVFIHSVGVPTWGGYKSEVVQRMREFVSHPNVKVISARDEESASWIKKHLKTDKVRSAVDLVCALNLPPVASADPPTLGIVTRNRGNKEDDYSQLWQLCERAADAGMGLRQIILGTGAAREKDLAAAFRFNYPGSSIFESEDLSALCRAIGECSALASMKFHGTVVATMYGLPSYVLSPTDKSRNFMRRIGREDLLSQLNSPSLPNCLDGGLRGVPLNVRSDLRSQALNELDWLKSQLVQL